MLAESLKGFKSIIKSLAISNKSMVKQTNESISIKGQSNKRKVPAMLQKLNGGIAESTIKCEGITDNQTFGFILISDHDIRSSNGTN